MQDKHLPSKHITYCLSALRQVQQAVVKQQWQRVPTCIHEYEKKMNELKMFCEAAESLSPANTEQLQHLLQQQRYVMRMVYQAQQNTEEGIAAVTNSLQKVKRLSLVTA